MPEVIEAFAKTEAENKGVAFHGSAMACMAVASAAIPDWVKIRPKVHEDWEERASIWVALVGMPSSLKSPTIRGAAAPLKKIEARVRGEYQGDMVDWELRRDIAKMNKEERPLSALANLWHPTPPRRLSKIAL